MHVLSVRPRFEAVEVAPGNSLMTPPGRGTRGLSSFVALTDSVDLPGVNISVLQMMNMFIQYIADNTNMDKCACDIYVGNIDFVCIHILRCLMCIVLCFCFGHFVLLQLVVLFCFRNPCNIGDFCRWCIFVLESQGNILKQKS